MPLSAALQQRITEARSVVQQHPQHELPPPFRHHLYIALGPRIRVANPSEASDISGFQRRALLSIMTARHVFPIWEQRRPEDLQPKLWMVRAEEIVRRTATNSFSVAEREAWKEGISREAWQYVEKISANARQDEVMAGFAAAAALRAALTDQLNLWEDNNLFHPAGMPEEMTDGELNVEDEDVALLAAKAYAGKDVDKRAVFWKWWLTEAIAAAWDAVPLPRPYPARADGLRVHIELSAELSAEVGQSEEKVPVFHISPDSTCLAFCAPGEPSRLWDVQEGGEIGVLEGSMTGDGSAHNGVAIFAPDSTVIFAPDSTIIAAPCWPNGIGLWTRDGLEIGSLAGSASTSVQSMCFSPDSMRLAAVFTDNSIGVWERTGTQLAVLAGSNTQLVRVVFSPDGKLLAALSVDGYVQLWDTDTWSSMLRFSALPESGRAPGDKSWFRWILIAFSSDGTRLVVRGRNAHGWVHVWNVHTAGTSSVDVQWTGTVLGLSHGPSSGIAFSPDGKLLAIGDKGDSDLPLIHQRPGILLLDAHTLEMTGFLPCPDDRPGAIAFSPDGSLLAMAGEGGGMAWIWDTVRQQTVASFPAHVDAWDAREGAPLHPFRDLAWAPSGRHIVTCGMDPDTPNPNHVRPYAAGVHYTVKLWEVRLTSEELEPGEGLHPLVDSPSIDEVRSSGHQE